MKTHWLLSLTFLLVFLPANITYAQISVIDSLKIDPANPTTSDIVKVISYTTFSTGGCPLTNSSVSIIGTTVNVYASHTLGILTYICHSIDTQTIGKLNSGSYDLIYHLTGTGSSTTFDIDTILFTVLQPTGLQPIDYPKPEIMIYPNPAATEINIDLLSNAAGRSIIDIYSVLGQKMRSVTTDKNSTHIDINDLNEGIYFFVITNGQERKWVKSVIINVP